MTNIEDRLSAIEENQTEIIDILRRWGMAHGLNLEKTTYDEPKTRPKTVKEWICTIKDYELRALTFERLNWKDAGNKKRSFCDAITGAFDWSKTKEGHNFWYYVAIGKQNMYSREDHVSLTLEHHIDDIEMRQGWL